MQTSDGQGRWLAQSTTKQKKASKPTPSVHIGARATSRVVALMFVRMLTLSASIAMVKRAVKIATRAVEARTRVTRAGQVDSSTPTRTTADIRIRKVGRARVITTADIRIRKVGRARVITTADIRIRKVGRARVITTSRLA